MQTRSLGALPKTCSSSAGFLLLRICFETWRLKDFSWHALFREKDEELIDQLERLPIQALRSNFCVSPNSRVKQIITETDCLQQDLPFKCGLKKVNGDICERRFASIKGWGFTTHQVDYGRRAGLQELQGEHGLQHLVASHISVNLCPWCLTHFHR